MKMGRDKKIKSSGQLISVVQNLYDNELIDWKPYCKIRNGLLDLKTSEELIQKLEKRIKYLEGKQFYNTIFKQGYEKAKKELQ